MPETHDAVVTVDGSDQSQGSGPLDRGRACLKRDLHFALDELNGREKERSECAGCCTAGDQGAQGQRILSGEDGCLDDVLREAVLEMVLERDLTCPNSV